MDAESTYLNLYDLFVDEAEYLQSDENQGRQFLAESVIIAAITAIFVSFCNGFFGRLGEKAADDVATSAKGAFKRAADTGDQTAVIEGLAILAPYLEQLSESNVEQRREEIRWLADTLERRGFPNDSAEAMASNILTVLRAAGAAS